MLMISLTVPRTRHRVTKWYSLSTTSLRFGCCAGFFRRSRRFRRPGCPEQHRDGHCDFGDSVPAEIAAMVLQQIRAIPGEERHRNRQRVGQKVCAEDVTNHDEGEKRGECSRDEHQWRLLQVG